jgi:phosphatidylserine decarboxylase
MTTMARRPKPTESEPTTRLAHFADLVRETVPPVHRAGIPFVAAGAAVAFAGRKHGWIRTPATAATLATAAFFRHPSRVPPNAAGVVVAPADGQVALVDRAAPPAELGLPDTPRPRISIFLSIFDVHVQRVPIAGTVQSVEYRPGKFVSADLPEASAENERNAMLITTDTGEQVVVVQIAGLIARRIVCEARPGDSVTLGDTYGLIRFGSRVDVYLPEGTRPLVAVGQRAVGAETVLAQLG